MTIWALLRVVRASRLRHFAPKTSSAAGFAGFFRVAAALLVLSAGSHPAQAQVPTSFSGQTSVGSISTPLLVTIKVTGDANASAPLALTQGNDGQDFAVATGGGCTAGTHYTVGQTCTVSVVFQPKAPGLRNGAVVLKGQDGSLLGEAFVNGLGKGPLAVLEPGRIDTVVGSGSWIYRADGVAATTAPIFLPMGVVVDAAGNIYLSDSNNNRIRRVDFASGLISTVAGNGSPGFTGDNGPATLASVSAPSGLVLDGAGNIYFDDTGNNCVRRIDSMTGIIRTVAGVCTSEAYSGDGGPATSARLNLPQGLAFDPSGNLLIADTGNNAVRKVDATTGIITTFAGSGLGTGGYNGDGRQATTAYLNTPWSVIVAADGTVFIADLNNDRVRRVDTAGVITTFAGTGMKGNDGNGGTATAATLNEPAALALDPAGNVYIADSGNNMVRKVSAKTGNISLIVGTGSEAFAGDAGPANLATIYGPYALFFDSKGNLLLSDMFHNRIRSVSGTSVALKFATLRVSKVSLPQAEVVNNDGNADLSPVAPVFNNSALDAATTTCNVGSVVTSGLSCTLGVQFAPTVVGDPVMGTLVQPSDASNSPITINLSGTVLSVEPTSTTLTSSQNPSLISTAVTFTATVKSADTTRSGPVVFLDGTAQICSANLTSSGTATCTTPNLTLGQHNITANYAGDANNASSKSAILIQVVKQPSSLVLTASPNPAVVTSTVTLTATATGATGTPTGTVTFLDGTTTIGSGTLDIRGVVTISTSALLPGTHKLTAQYAGDSGNSATTSPAVSEVITQATTVTTLSTSNATVPVGTPVTFTATVSSSLAAAPGGTASFLDGSATIGTATLTSGVGTLTLSTLAPGSHVITAVYGGDTNDATSTSAALTETVNQIATSTLLSVDVNPANAGATIHLTATVLIDPTATPAGALAGQVTFMDGSNNLGVVALNASGIATLSISTLSVGSHALTAIYAGSTNYAKSTSTVVTEQIQQTPTTTALSASSSTTLAGKPVTLTAAVTSTTGIPTGSVTFRDGATNLGVASVNAQGVATLTLSNLSVSSHNITAVYGGDASYITSTSSPLVEIILLGTSTLTLSGPAATIDAGTPAVFTVVLGSDGVAPTGALTLRDGSTVIATQSVSATGTFTFSISTLAVGTHTITATYAGDANNSSSISNSVAVIVQLAATTTTLQSNRNPQVLGQPVVLTSTVVSTSPNIGGTVTFMDGATIIGSAAVNAAGTATLTTTTLTFGVHTLTAAYSGDSTHAASTSPALSQSTVQPATVTLTSSNNPAIAGTNVTFTATVTGVAGLVPTGLVTFLDGAVVLGTGTLDATGTASYTTATLSVATHPITASYPGDKNYAAAVSPALTETVQNQSTQVTLTASANPATYGTAVTLTATVKTNGGGPTGTVVFNEGTTTIGTSILSASGVATISTSALAPGSHNIVATYTGDSKASGSVSTPLTISVLQTTSLVLNSSANPSVTLNAITLTVTISNNGLTVPTGTVTFTDGSVKLGTSTVDSAGRATLTVPSLAAGSHTVVTSYTGDTTNFPGTSPSVVQVVQLRPTTDTLTATSTSTTNSQQVLLISVVRWTGPTVPTGIVTFTSGGQAIGTAAVDSTGVATLTITVQSTSQSIIASYGGDANYAASDSVATSITGGAATQFTLSLNPSSMSMPSKQHGTITMTLTSVKDFTDTLEFGCLGLPYAATCTFDKTQMVLQPNGTATMKMTLDTGNPLGAGAQASVQGTSTSGVLLCAIPFSLISGLLLWRKRRVTVAGLLMMLFAVAFTMSATGCSGLSVNGTPAGTYSFKVSAQGKGTGASQAQTMTLTVTE